MNLFPGAQVGDGVVHAGEITVPLPQRLLGWVHRGQIVTLGVRPEAAQIFTEERPDVASVQLQGVVEIIEPDHGRRLQWLHLRAGEHTYTVAAPFDLPLHVGHTVQAVLPLDQVYFFDGLSGVRL